MEKFIVYPTWPPIRWRGWKVQLIFFFLLWMLQFDSSQHSTQVTTDPTKRMQLWQQVNSVSISIPSPQVRHFLALSHCILFLVEWLKVLISHPPVTPTNLFSSNVVAITVPVIFYTCTDWSPSTFPASPPEQSGSSNSSEQTRWRKWECRRRRSHYHTWHWLESQPCSPDLIQKSSN